MFTRRKQQVAVPEVGEEAPAFNLPSAQGGQLRLSMRTVRGPVVVAFYDTENAEDVEYFRALAAKEDEINLASGSVVGVGVAEPDRAREFARETGMKSYLLYDYAKVTTREWGLLERDRKNGDFARPAVFIVGPDHNIAHAWVGERPAPEELLARVSEITGLPRPAEEKEQPEPAAAEGGEQPKKLSAEDRERIKAERRAAREAGKSVKTEVHSGQPASAAAPEGGDAPKKMSAEERARIKAERRAAREAGKSLKTDASATATAPAAAPETTAGAEAGPKKMSAEERERIKAERRAAREAGKSLKQPISNEEAPVAQTEAAAPASPNPDQGSAPKKMSAEERERIKAERRAAREAGRSLKTGNGGAPLAAGESGTGPEEEN